MVLLSPGVAEVKKVEGEARKADTLGVTLRKYIVIFYFFIFVKMFLWGTNPSTDCFSFSARIIERSMSQKKSKAV